MIPSYMLRQLYEKGSLKNIVDDKGNITGFCFSLFNRLGTGTIKGGFSLLVDGTEISPANIRIEKGGITSSLEEFAKSPVRFAVGDRIRFLIEKSGGLQPGVHKLVVRAMSTEYGRVEFDFSDTVS